MAVGLISSTEFGPLIILHFPFRKESGLLQAHAHIWNHIFSFIRSMSPKCAIDIGIPDIIQNHGKPITVTELVAAFPTLNPTKACNIYRLMCILVHSGFFARQKLVDDVEEDGYFLTNASRPLLNDNPLSATPYLKSMLDQILMQPWHFLGEWFQNDDRTSFVTAHGKMLWDYCLTICGEEAVFGLGFPILSETDISKVYACEHIKTRLIITY
ncbi:hypothetical protein V6N11_054139 [Hibiscus sabdariffa]|uniref:O-methyltransferase dimerisation domain-containing protein n=1 Tax=Hibiscus sabdariffa TaxID=183260 RepID=A0ABR2S3V5_9ROSI